MNRFSHSRRVAVIACVAVATIRPVLAQPQASTGLISGFVLDSSGAVLPGATVTISNAATGAPREVVTDQRGLYTLPLVPVGTYELTVERQGFRPEKVSGLQVTVGSGLPLDVTMQVGTISESVTVTNSPSPLKVTSPVPSTTFETTFIEKLPTNGRRFQDLVVLTPHAQVDIQRGQLVLSGQRGINSNINIDGSDYNQPFFGGIRGGSRSNFAPTIPQEAIREFQVIASGYSTEFGRSSGGLVTVVTRSGANRSSGSGFYVNRHADLAASNVFGQQTAPTQQQWGGSFGGPIRRNRVFFFGAYEQQAVSTPGIVFFDALENFTPTATTQEAFDYFKSLEEPFTETNDAVTLLGRLDWELAGGSRFDVRYSGSRNIGLNAVSPGNAAFATTPSALSHNGTERDRVDTVVGQYTNVLRSNSLLEIRGQYSREARHGDANAIAPRVMTEIGRFGTVAFLGQNATVDSRAQAAANLTWLTGRHGLKAGAEVNTVFVDQTVGLNQTGNFLIGGSNPATILATLSAGPTQKRFDSVTVAYRKQLGDLQQSFVTNEIAAFVQDSWRVGRNLQLTYGLRWEGQWYPPPDANNRDLTDRLAGFTFPLGRQVDPNVVPDALAQVAPRAGLAWDPWSNGKTVVRGNAGIYYARSPGLIFAGPLDNFGLPPGDLSVQLPFTVPADIPQKTVYQQFALIGIDLNRTPLDKLPILTPNQIADIAQALGLSDPYVGVQPIVVDPQFKNPKAYQWGIGVERALTDGLTVGADYSSIRTVNLERNIDLNMPLPFVQESDPSQRPFFGVRSGRQPRPIPSLGQVIVRESSARAHYRALALRTRLKRGRGELNASYVLSKSLSDDDNEADIGGLALENVYNPAPEYSFARLDRRHQLSGGWMLELPYGIEASGSFQFRSGVPIDARVGGDLNEDLGGPDRPYLAPGVSFERNMFRNRTTSNLDLRVSKNVYVTSGRRLAIFMDVFNLFNVANIQYAGREVTDFCAAPVPTCGFAAPSNPNFLQLVDRDPASPDFGSYLLNNTPGEPRQIQLGLRIAF